MVYQETCFEVSRQPMLTVNLQCVCSHSRDIGVPFLQRFLPAAQRRMVTECGEYSTMSHTPLAENCLATRFPKNVPDRQEARKVCHAFRVSGE